MGILGEMKTDKMMGRNQIWVLMIFLLNVTMTNAQKSIDPEPQFVGYHFTNRHNEKIEKVVGQDKYVYLVLETTNAIGEKVILNFEEIDDYIYKNKYIVANSSVNFIVKKDIQKVKFEIYDASKKKHRKLKFKLENNISQ